MLTLACLQQCSIYHSECGNDNGLSLFTYGSFLGGKY
jgi:hypothetical protein